MALGQKQKIYPWNRIESPKINLCICGQLIYDKVGKNIQWREDNLFNKWCGENWIAIIHVKNEIRTLFNTKHIKELNVRLDTAKLLKENIGRKLSDFNCNFLFDLSPRVMEIKAKINK